MNAATQIVHWPGKDVATCDKHAAQLKAVGEAMGFTLSSTSCQVDGLACKNCENEEKKAAEKGF